MLHDDFSRILLADAVADARRLGAKVGKASVVCSFKKPTGDKCYLFEYDGFSVEVWADNAYHARSLGWERWIAAETANRKA